LREKIGENCLKTVKGVGYKFEFLWVTFLEKHINLHQ
jgi:hypothetical protein